jgi:tetratricopeptide (TPR) repeat protein
MRTLISIGLLLGAVVVRAQGALCVIGQPAAINGSAIIDLMNPLANELDGVGQLQSVTYAIEDPILRDAFLAGKIKKPDRFYTLEDVLSAAKALNAPFAIWIEGQNSNLKNTQRTDKVLYCHLTLYKNGKKLWDDTDGQSVIVGNDRAAEDTIRSVMSSLDSKLQLGPLKGFAKHPKNADPVVGKGQAPIILEGSDDDPTLNDWNAIKNQVKEHINNKKVTAAEMLLRDSIDAAPSDPVRRKALIEFLQANGQVDAAVAVTIASAEALGDPTMITSAARILLDANRIPEASEMVKDAMAADPNNSVVQLIQAEIQMRSAMPDQALKHLENSIKTKPTPEAFLLRGICRGLLGSEDGVKLDMDRATKDDPQIYASQYSRVASILDAAWEAEGPDVRAIFQKAILKRSSEEVIESVDAQERMAKACILLLGDNAPNLRFEKSHGIRLLALNLLIQTTTELRHYLAKGDEGSLTDARNDFGEVLKTLTEAKVQFSKESSDARNSNPPGQL